MEIVRYHKEYKESWDKFVDSSKNGTFLLKRDFMEYHADRFEDCSFLFFDKQKLQAIMPGNIDVENNTFYSHQGLTYGGFVLSYEISASTTLSFLEKLLSELKERYKVNRFIYRNIPAIYHRYPAEEDLYALFRCGARIIERKISSTLKLPAFLPFEISRKRGVNKGIKSKLEIVENDNFTAFWEILNRVLSDRHQALPVHNVEEIKLLKSKFPEEIHLFEVKKDNEIIAGCVMFNTEQTAHVQYTAANETGRKLGALDFLFNYLIKNEYSDREYFDFGVSVENGGLILNEGLIFQKEGFGGRGVMYDTYLIEDL